MPPSSNSSDTPQRKNRTSIHGRMGMRKWMELLLDNKQCHGLQWEDKSKKIFSIVWKHASSHGFDHSKHADVFIQWARYKGRTVKEERNQKKKKGDNYDSKYKSNFRCALHSLIDCIEINGDEDGRKKYFQFISPSHPQYKERRDKKRNSYNKKAQKRTHDGKFSEGPKTEHKIDIVKDELKGRCETDEKEIIPPQEKDFGHNMGEKVLSIFKGMKENDIDFSGGQKAVQSVNVKEELKEIFVLNQNEIVTLQETEFGTALEGDQNNLETLTENSNHLSGQSLQTVPFHEMGNVAVPMISILPNERTGPFKIIYEETSQEPSSSLPNFEALGVKDQYGPKTYVTSTLLASGGDVKVKKVAKETTEFAQPITVELLQSNSVNSQNVNCVSNMEPSQSDVNTVDTLGLSQTNNEFSANSGFELINTGQGEVEDLLCFLPGNSSQYTDMSVGSNMYIPQEQEPFNNPYLLNLEDGGVITRANDIINNNDMPFPVNLEELELPSDLDQPFCDSL